MTFDGFIGPSYISASEAWDGQRSINLLLEVDESGAGKSPRALLQKPGLALFSTLAAAPVRGIWTGLADALPGSTATDLAFAVGGSKLYSVASTGTATEIGDVGDDAAHSPVTFQVNGGQLFLTSAGLAWVYDATGLAQAFFNNGTGTVNTSSTAVTWVSGDQFDSTLVGSEILIAGAAYVITAFVDATHVTLGASAGTQTGAAYSVCAGGGTVDTVGTAVHSTAGDLFTGIPAGAKIVIGTTLYTVSSVTDATHLVLTGSAGTQTGAAASFPLPVLAAMSAFLDSYFMALPPNSKKWYICQLDAAGIGDGHLWSPVDFARKSAFPDNIAAMLGDHEDLWLAGSEQIEVWRNTGAADFPFQRDPGAVIAQGIRAPFTLVPFADGVAWLGGDTRGNPVMWHAAGFQPRRISTHGTEKQWTGYSSITDARSYAFTHRGHQILRVTFPTGASTWDYDFTSGTWTLAGAWSNAGSGSIIQHRSICHSYGFSRHLVGDFATGAIYDMSDAYFDDAGTAMHCVRYTPHLSDEELWTFYARFRLAMQAGIYPTLSWSDDLQKTFHTEKRAANRLMGGATQWSIWKRLGKARDRVWRVSVAPKAGTASTSGTAVTWISGDDFTTAQKTTIAIAAGDPIAINGLTYTVLSVTDSTHLVLTATAGTQTAKAFSSPPAAQVAFLAAYLDLEQAGG